MSILSKKNFQDRRESGEPDPEMQVVSELTDKSNILEIHIEPKDFMAAGKDVPGNFCKAPAKHTIHRTRPHRSQEAIFTSDAMTGARLPASAILASGLRRRSAAHSMAANMATARIRSSSGSEKFTPACWNASFAVHSPSSTFRIASTSSAPCMGAGCKDAGIECTDQFPPGNKQRDGVGADVGDDHIVPQ